MSETWDNYALAAMSVLVPLSAQQLVDDYGPKEVASDAFNFADAMVEEKKRRQTFNWEEAKERMKRGETVIDRFGVLWAERNYLPHYFANYAWHPPVDDFGNFGIGHPRYEGWRMP